MNTKIIIKNLMNKNGIGNAKLSNRLGISPQAMFDRLSHTDRDLNVAIAVDMLKAMDYKMIVVPANKPIPEGCFEVTR